MPARVYDVVIIGYGPVSQTLALALGRQNRSVAVVERWHQRYPLPRAVCIDHELYRVLAANGLDDILPSISHGGALYQWFNADWRELLVIDWTAEAVSGGPSVNFVHQPTLEEALDAAVTAQPTVETLLGWEAIGIEQDADSASVTLVQQDGDERRTVTGRYVIGCDGANSLTRQTIGGGQHDLGFEADWLVIDVRLKDGVTIEQLGIPASGQYCNPIQPTTIVPAGVRDGRRYRRWEFMRLPGVSIEDLEREDRVWELLSPWAGPDQVELVRHKVYNFRSLLADRWRDRRVLIAGDAAHVMPPFLGQGMCSGMRDAWNLAWKLSLILDGKADDRLLDTYQLERLPHISKLIEMSIFLGKIICIPDAAAAAARDKAFFEGTHPPFPAFPQLEDGVVRRIGGALQPGAGQLAPHFHVRTAEGAARLDDATGPKFVLFLPDTADADILDAGQHERLAALGTSIVATSRDLDDRLAPFLAELRWTAMIVRPDYYIYGGVGSLGELPALVDALLDDLTAVGVRSAVPEHA